MTVFVVWQVAKQIEGDKVSPLIELVTTQRGKADQFVEDHQYQERVVTIGNEDYLVVHRGIVQAELDELDE